MIIQCFKGPNLDVDVDTYIYEALERSYGRSIVVEYYDEY